jgi:hypothetical protein
MNERVPREEYVMKLPNERLYQRLLSLYFYQGEEIYLSKGR